MKEFMDKLKRSIRRALEERAREREAKTTKINKIKRPRTGTYDYSKFKYLELDKERSE